VAPSPETASQPSATVAELIVSVPPPGFWIPKDPLTNPDPETVSDSIAL